MKSTSLSIISRAARVYSPSRARSKPRVTPSLAGQIQKPSHPHTTANNQQTKEMANVLYTHSNPAAAPLVIYCEQDNCYAMKIEVPVFEKKRHEHTTVRRLVNRNTGFL